MFVQFSNFFIFVYCCCCCCFVFLRIQKFGCAFCVYRFCDVHKKISMAEETYFAWGTSFEAIAFFKCSICLLFSLVVVAVIAVVLFFLLPIISIKTTQ